MKKITAFIIVLALVLALAACGSKEAAAPGSGGQSSSGQSAEAQKTEASEGEKNGEPLSREDDEPLSREDEPAESEAESPQENGSEGYQEGEPVIVEGENGEVYQYGGDWPENEYTEAVPRPKIDVYAAGTEEEEFTVMFSGASVDDIKAYAEELKAAGFTVDPDEEDVSYGGMTVYTYSASNRDGFHVDLFYSVSQSGMMITEE